MYEGALVDVARFGVLGLGPGAVWALTQLTLSLFGGLCIGAILGAVLGGWLGLNAGFAEGTDSLAQLLNAVWQGILGAETGALVGGGSGLLLSLSLSLRNKEN